MTRPVTYRDYLDATGAAVCEMIVRYSVPAAREAGAALIKGQPVDAAYLPTPFGAKGEPFDPPEVGGTVHVSELRRATIDEAFPPNCDGFTHAGEALAHAQHSAATEGDDCTSGACLITRGSD